MKAYEMLRADLIEEFDSYSHRLDRGLAPAVQTGLQRLAKPWFRRYALRVFRDSTDLGASPSLWFSVRRALVRSKHFILLASPQAAASTWVQREVRLSLRLNGMQRMYVAITGGNDPIWSSDTASVGKRFPLNSPTLLYSLYLQIIGHRLWPPLLLPGQ